MRAFTCVHLQLCEEIKAIHVHLVRTTTAPVYTGSTPQHALEYSLELDGCLLQIVDVKEPAEKDIQTRCKDKAGPLVTLCAKAWSSIVLGQSSLLPSSLVQPPKTLACILILQLASPPCLSSSLTLGHPCP